MKKKEKKEKPHDIDVLEAYPEKEQVDAFPERRYIKLTRFLTIFSTINLAMVIAYSGIYYYLARNVDTDIASHGVVHMYAIDPERKLLLPSEPAQTRVSARQLVMEDALRKYLQTRYAIIWDMDKMRRNWGEEGYVASLSTVEVFTKFSSEAGRIWETIKRERFTRDVHIYSLYPVHGDLWSAYIETFDFPLDENLEKKCDCSDNSHECLSCKEIHSIPNGRRRKKILLRADFSGKKTLSNPMGILVYAYYPAFVPVVKENNEKFWDLPAALRPEI